MSSSGIDRALAGIAIDALFAEYALRLDEDRLEAWAELFLPEAEYKIVTRENVEQGLPNVLVWCDNRAMIEDRIESYRNVNEYNLHWARHVIGPRRLREEAPGRWRAEAGYSLFQSDLEGESRLFSVGRYEAVIVLDGEIPRLASMLVVADTGLIPTLLAAPI